MTGERSDSAAAPGAATASGAAATRHGSIKTALIFSHIALALSMGILVAAAALYVRWDTTPDGAQAQVNAEAQRIGRAVSAQCCNENAMLIAADRSHTRPEAVIIMWASGHASGYHYVRPFGDPFGTTFNTLALGPYIDTPAGDIVDHKGEWAGAGVLAWAPVINVKKHFVGAVFVQRGFAITLSTSDWVVLGSLVLLGVFLGLLAAIIVGRRITQPIRSLAVAAYRGALGEKVDVLPTGGLREIEVLSHTISESIDLGQFSAQAELAKFQRHRALMKQLSHDLQGPTDTIALQLQALAELEERDDPGAPDRRARLRADIEDQVTRLNGQIREVVIRASGDGVDDTERIVDLSALVRHAVADFDALISFSRGTCVTTIDDGVRVWARPVALSAVARELVRNALKHTARSDIAVSLTTDGDRAVLVVGDSGPGIPQSERAAALEEGRQGAGAGGGFGLGLAMARDELDQIGATLALGTSALLGGLEVEVTFPLATGHLPAPARARVPGPAAARPADEVVSR